jgi:hypothetical protein
LAIVSEGQYNATAPTLTDGQYVKLQTDVRGHLKTTEGFSTSAITYYPAAALTWTAVTPSPASSKLTIQNADATKYTLIATEYIHLAQDGTLPLTQAPPFSAGATLYAGAIEMQLDLNTHVASTALHKVAGDPTYPVHKVADATNTCGAAASNDSTDVSTLANDLIDQLIAHIGGTTWHVTATGTITHTNGSSESTNTTLVNLIRTSLIAHLSAASDALHGQVADTVNRALVNATTAATNAATNKTLVNLLRTYYLAHIALGGAAASEATVVAQANAVRIGMLAHLANVTTWHQTADTVNLALVNATTIATNAATALILMNDLATPYYAHLAFYQRMKYAAASTIEWFGQTPLYVAIESAGGFTVLTES